MLPKVKKMDPRVIRTRRDLAASMCTLMRRKSFSQITVLEIAEQALINRATFYAHFEDKYKLLEHMVQETFQEKLEQKISACDGFTPDNLRLLMQATCEFLEEFDDHYAPHPGQDHPPIEQLIQPHIHKILLAWLKASGLAESADTLAMATSWTIFGTALQWSRGPREISTATLIDQVLSLITKGIDTAGTSELAQLVATTT